jgi:hypothetical protein
MGFGQSFPAEIFRRTIAGHHGDGVFCHLPAVLCEETETSHVNSAKKVR